MSSLNMPPHRVLGGISIARTQGLEYIGMFRGCPLKPGQLQLLSCNNCLN
jgi:hypothetical protein